jgi:hypothetical protein
MRFYWTRSGRASKPATALMVLAAYGMTGWKKDYPGVSIVSSG